jgi:hypothetical protein
VATEDWKRKQRDAVTAKVQSALDTYPDEAVWWATWNYLAKLRQDAKGGRKKS